MIPQGTVVRIVRKRPLERKPKQLLERWPADVEQIPFDPLHADMRMSEAKLAGPFRKAYKLGQSRVAAFNQALYQHAGFQEKFKKQENSKSYAPVGLSGVESPSRFGVRSSERRPHRQP